MNDYLALAKEIADEAAVIAVKYFGFDTENTWKGDNTPLTQADTEINSLVIKKVNAAYPDHSILGEEESKMKDGSKLVWVCDPIDGTMPFSNGLPIFTFSLALVDQATGQPILGLINDPMMKNMYWATTGSGAFRNGKKISVLQSSDLKNAYVSVDGSGKKIDVPNSSIIKAFDERGAKVMKLTSIVYGAVQVANGKFLGSIFLGSAAHDVAALAIITQEAGGKATDLNGEPRRYDQNGFGCVISNGAVHDELVGIVKESKI